jgi:hypothetical protein
MTNDHNFVLAVAAAASAVTVVWRQRNEAVMLGERIDGLEVRQGYASGSWGVPLSPKLHRLVALQTSHTKEASEVRLFPQRDDAQ